MVPVLCCLLGHRFMANNSLCNLVNETWKECRLRNYVNMRYLRYKCGIYLLPKLNDIKPNTVKRKVTEFWGNKEFCNSNPGHHITTNICTYYTNINECHVQPYAAIAELEFGVRNKLKFPSNTDCDG